MRTGDQNNEGDPPSEAHTEETKSPELPKGNKKAGLTFLKFT